MLLQADAASKYYTTAAVGSVLLYTYCTLSVPLLRKKIEMHTGGFNLIGGGFC